MEMNCNRSGIFFALILILQTFLIRNVAAELGQSDTNCSPCCRGLPGRDGRDGRDASLVGPQGPRGRTGFRGPPGQKGNDGLPGGSVVYTRWGRTTCPTTAGTSLVYSGTMAGSHYTHNGGASNYLCLPKDPIYDKVKAGSQGTNYIYGVEYETNQNNLFSNNLHDHEAPCAVCLTQSRSSHVMIPARNVCPSGWTMEYKGYIMAEHYGHKRTQFICVDSDAEAIPGTEMNLNGALLYFVESHCGALPCPPYTQGNELTCAVCTK